METKTCPNCGKLMILRFTGECELSYPGADRREWWCGCGHTEAAPSLKRRSREEIDRRNWEEANGVKLIPQRSDQEQVPCPQCGRRWWVGGE